jgi:hypothetical protein
MARITASIEEVELDGEFGLVAGVAATCNKCDHSTESFGTEGGSIRRCLVLLREECPGKEGNFYMEEE